MCMLEEFCKLTLVKFLDIQSLTATICFLTSIKLMKK